MFEVTNCDLKRQGSRDFCRRMYEETGAFCVPGDCFDEPFSFRVGYGHEADVLRKGLDAVSEFIRRVTRD